MGIKSAKAKNRNDKKIEKKMFMNGSRAAVRIREDQQDYARVTKVLGNCRFMVLLSCSMIEQIGVLCGGLHRRGWLMVDSLVLVSIRDFQNDKVDIIHKYGDADVRRLMAMGEITTGFMSRDGDKDKCFDTFDLNEEILGGNDNGGVGGGLEKKTTNHHDHLDDEEDKKREVMNLEDMLPPPYEAYDSDGELQQDFFEKKKSSSKYSLADTGGVTMTTSTEEREEEEEEIDIDFGSI
jgi:translation initiation factor 1A